MFGCIPFKVTEPLTTCEPLNTLLPVVAKLLVSIAIDDVATASATPSSSPTQKYPSCILGKSLLLPLPCTTISPSLAFTLPTTPMFCTNTPLPVGLVSVKLPLVTYMFLPAVNPAVLTPISLPVTVASPVALLPSVSCSTAIAGIVEEEL